MQNRTQDNAVVYLFLTVRDQVWLSAGSSVVKLGAWLNWRVPRLVVGLCLGDERETREGGRVQICVGGESNSVVKWGAAGS